MSLSKIKQPNDQNIQTSDGTARLSWDTTFAVRKNQDFLSAQKYVDSEVLRGCTARVPFQTGALARSGQSATTIGSGEVNYSAVYARYQYYNTAQTRSYDANRGVKWFERMKAAEKESIMRGAKQYL